MSPPTNASSPTLVILMGVSGSGKSTIGTRLAAELGWCFYEGDDFHPEENVSKMASGMPLTDADRSPWLEKISGLIAQCLEQNRSAVIACSALKEKYRERLQGQRQGVLFVFLEGEYEVVFQRMKSRSDHYMMPTLLRSQYEDLEPPASDEAIIVNVENDVGAIVAEIASVLQDQIL